jgi:hypothetical protein
VRSYNTAVSANEHYILGGQLALVYPGRRDPDIAVVFFDGKVAPGKGGHASVIDAFYGVDQLLAGM